MRGASCVDPVVADQAACILLVEDDSQLLDQLRDILIEFGYAVLTATNPFDAYYVLEQGGVDLLLTDVRWPGKTDGAMLATEVSARWPHVQILAISGSSPPEGALPPNARFLQKPFHLSKLVSEVGMFLRQ